MTHNGKNETNIQAPPMVDPEDYASFAKDDTNTRPSSSHHNAAMGSSVFRFKDINFAVGKGDNQKRILQDVSGTIKWGHVLAVMGPSGAGKTTLINALTLEAFYGVPTGAVTLNGVRMTDKVFKKHCFVVKQQDKHWPYLTTRETLYYASELYGVASKHEIDEIVSDMISKMGLDSCADTRCARLSGGQRRRLSIAVALLKQPTLLFLDEPTSGLDAAAASNIMQEIIRVAKEERIIILATIHQPSTKVYDGFDQVMILSKGREAFTGNSTDAVPYFESIGHPVPPATNPAEHFLDLVNADFSSNDEVDMILDHWEENRSDLTESTHGKKGYNSLDDTQEGVVDPDHRAIFREISIMFRRHTLLILRDPVLYLGRSLIFLFANMFFAFVYWNAQAYTQDQATNKMWLTIWFVGVPSNMGVVAVYALNDEFKSISRETKNGMVSAISYLLAKTVLVIPIMLIFAIFALGIPAYAIQDQPVESFGMSILLWSSLIYVFECAAEFLAVAFDDPIMGMLQYMNIWFASFLFGGFLMPLQDMFWPFKLFYYIMPYVYYVRSQMYITFIDSDWMPCTDPEKSPVCVNTSDGAAVLDELGKIISIVSSKDTVSTDIATLIGIALFYKLMSIVTIFYKSRKIALIK